MSDHLINFLLYNLEKTVLSVFLSTAKVAMSLTPFGSIQSSDLCFWYILRNCWAIWNSRIIWYIKFCHQFLTLSLHKGLHFPFPWTAWYLSVFALQEFFFAAIVCRFVLFFQIAICFGQLMVLTVTCPYLKKLLGIVKIEGVLIPWQLLAMPFMHVDIFFFWVHFWSSLDTLWSWLLVP